MPLQLWRGVCVKYAWPAIKDPQLAYELKLFRKIIQGTDYIRANTRNKLLPRCLQHKKNTYVVLSTYSEINYEFGRFCLVRTFFINYAFGRFCLVRTFLPIWISPSLPIHLHGIFEEVTREVDLDNLLQAGYRRHSWDSLFSLILILRRLV
jgi:hypothetical protein